MSIVQTGNLTGGLFVPYMQMPRGGKEHGSPVGTIHQEIVATGDGSGGGVTIQVRATRTMFGFRALFIPTWVAVRDGQAAVGPVELIWTSLGNRRLSLGLRDVVTTVRISGTNLVRLSSVGIVVEPPDDTLRDIIQVAWATNTNAISYVIAVFGVLYDLEILEKYGTLDALITGVR